MAVQGGNRMLAARTLHGIAFFMEMIMFIWLLILPYLVPEHLLDNELVNRMWSNKYYMLSFWIEVLQFIFFGLHFIIDITAVYRKESNYYKYKEKFENITNYMLYSLLFPFTLSETLMFWCWFNWDREILFPQAFDEFVHPLLNHMIHTFQTPLIFIFLLLSDKRRVPKICHSLIGLLVPWLIYQIFFWSYRFITGNHIYPIMTRLPHYFIFFFSNGTVFGFFLLGYVINSLKNNLVDSFNKNYKLE